MTRRKIQPPKDSPTKTDISSEDKIVRIQKQIQELKLFKLKLNITLSELVYELALEKIEQKERLEANEDKEDRGDRIEPLTIFDDTELDDNDLYNTSLL